VQKVVDDFRGTYPVRDIRFTPNGIRPRSRGDEIWTEQILSNLISNAIKYSPTSEPVDVSVEQRDTHVVVSVADRGPGIAGADSDRIFERFKRLGDHMTRTTSGSGLGLYIARQLAQAVGGELTVLSLPGAGATFVLTLPAAPVVAAPDLVSQAS
jgi:signal transduction histidine kinase